MSDEFFYDPAALHHDVEVLARWRSQLSTMAEAVPLELDAASLTSIPGASGVQAVFAATATMLRTYLADGAGECEKNAARLDETVRIYAEAEGESIDDIAVVSRKLDSL